MSDFDKEAERERLREKYERDQEKRESTQRMSELLLQGATMTNRHCGNCGDPIFRYEGEEFCPTCQQSASAGETEEETPADRATDAGADGVSGSETAEQSVEVTPEGNAGGASSDAEPGVAGAVDADRATEADRAAIDGRANASTDAGPPAARQTPPPSTDEGRASRATGDLEAARASLVRTVTRFARAAEETDDPRRAAERLTAAREAAETLAALER